MSMAEKIRILRVKCGNLSERELAIKAGTTPQNLNNKMKRDDFRISELEQIAKALDVEFVCSFKFKDGTEI